MSCPCSPLASKAVQSVAQFSNKVNHLLHVQHGAYKRGLLVVVCLMLATVLTGAERGRDTSAQTTENKAGLVVQFPDKTTQTYCLTFDGDTISGLDLLSKSGLPLKVEAYGGMGAEICQIAQTGCDYPNDACACQSYGPNGVYWSYHHLKNGAWKASITGAGSYRVHPGDVEGWAWSSGAPPQVVYTFSQLCPTAEPPPTATEPEPTDTPIPTTTPTLTRTPKPLPPSPTVRQPIEDTVQPSTPTVIQPTETTTPLPLTQTSTVAPTPTATIAPTDTPTAAPPTSTSTIGATATATATPTPPPADREGTARTIGLVIAGGVGVALAVWGLITVAQRRKRPREE